MISVTSANASTASSDRDGLLRSHHLLGTSSTRSLQRRQASLQILPPLTPFSESTKSMPLASSREASLKRAQALEAEKKERKRMRASLPYSVDSSIKVDEKKARRSIARRRPSRRQSFGIQNNENTENEQQGGTVQGPTAYSKVSLPCWFGFWCFGVPLPVYSILTHQNS